MAETLIMCRLGEVWLKGRNRSQFLQRLRSNLKATIDAAGCGGKVRKTHGRLWVALPDASALETALEVCRDTPGFTSVSPVVRVETDLDAITAAGIELAQASWPGASGSFKADSRRVWKQFPVPSPTIDRHVGGAVAGAMGFSVDLKRPDRTLGIEVDEHGSYLWTRVESGVGGLPVGCTGRVMLMLSGGIDSPVAGYLAQKRGCSVDAVYFHSPPFISEASRDKVETLARTLAPRQSGLKLHIAHFTEIQKAIRADCDGRLTVLLYRRFMYRIAAALALGGKSTALCTGENLGQVASQTLENLGVVDGVTPLMTLRPLICFDKREIINIARRIGTYETSILPHDDCCTLFVPRNPALRASVRTLEKAEAALDVDALVAEALERTEVMHC